MTAPTCGARTVRLELPGAIDEITEAFARALVASLQRQLDALDPDAAIAEAERRMLDACHRAERLDMLSAQRRHEAALTRESDAAHIAEGKAVGAWLALVEARDAKGGGA